jgi:hypothetical protein
MIENTMSAAMARSSTLHASSKQTMSALANHVNNPVQRLPNPLRRALIGPA